MSMTLMVKAMTVKIGNPIQKLILIKLADNANDGGECWPSYQHIASHCEVDKRTVMRHIKALIEKGYLTSENRSGPKGNTSNLYRLTLVTQDHNGVTQDHHPSDTRSPTLVTQDHPEPVNIEPVNEPKERGKANRFSAPTVKQVREYCIERGNAVDPQVFVDFYQSKDWAVGKSKMKDWKACVRTWESRQGKSYNGSPKMTITTSDENWFDKVVDTGY